MGEVGLTLALQLQGLGYLGCVSQRVSNRSERRLWGLVVRPLADVAGSRIG